MSTTLQNEEELEGGEGAEDFGSVPLRRLLENKASAAADVCKFGPCHQGCARGRTLRSPFLSTTLFATHYRQASSTCLACHA
jgi:hypothetical protein